MLTAPVSGSTSTSHTAATGGMRRNAAGELCFAADLRHAAPTSNNDRRRSVPPRPPTPASGYTRSSGETSSMLRGDLAGAFADLAAGVHNERAGEPHRAVGMRAAARGNHRVSPVIRRTCWGLTPSWSAATWAKLVSWPCPLDCVPAIELDRAIRRQHRCFHALVRRANRRLDVVRHADTRRSARACEPRRGVAEKPLQSANWRARCMLLRKSPLS